MSAHDLLTTVSHELKKREFIIATAESCTGGLLAHTLTNVSGSSDYFDRGVIIYSNKAKQEILGVPEHLLQQYGAVSHQVAEAMARGIQQQSKADIGISTTGISGPTGGTKDKPVGLVYIGIATTKDVVVKQYHFTGDRLSNKQSTVDAALQLLLEILSEETS